MFQCKYVTHQVKDVEKNEQTSEKTSNKIADSLFSISNVPMSYDIHRKHTLFLLEGLHNFRYEVCESLISTVIDMIGVRQEK